MFFLVKHRSNIILTAILLLHVGLGVWGMQGMGVSQETAWSWLGGTPTQLDPSTATTHVWGPFQASTERPVETLNMGHFTLPVAINEFTGGIGTWPAHIAAFVGISHEASHGINLFLSCLLIALVHRFVKLRASPIAAHSAALFLATDWMTLFVRRAFGGTEILLSASCVLCLWALWSRRWGAGRHGITALALGASIGMAAQFTFAITIVALFTTALVMRWDKPDLKPPLPSRWLPIAMACIVPSVPMLIGLAHLSSAGLTADLVSYPLSSQWDPSIPREDLASGVDMLKAWMGDGPSTLTTIWGAQSTDWFSPLRAVGWCIVILGTAAAWQDTDKTPRMALTRFCSILVPLQTGLIALLVAEPHHLAITAPGLAIWAGLATEVLFGHLAPPRSFRRMAVVFLGCLPWVVVNLRSAQASDSILETIKRPTVTASGQQQLIEMLDRNDATRVVTLDHDAVGLLDLLTPRSDFHHGWPRLARQNESTLLTLVSAAADNHLLTIAHPNRHGRELTPRELDLERAAEQAGVVLVAVDRLPDDAAVLYAVGWRKDQP